jgi:hypothetical protein
MNGAHGTTDWFLLALIFQEERWKITTHGRTLQRAFENGAHLSYP